MRKKKDLPLAILKAFEPFVKLKGERFEIIDPDAFLLHAIDKDLDSSFHFTIEKHSKDKNNGNFIVLMTRSPKNENDNGIFQNWINVSNISNEFNYWLSLLEQYNQIESFFEDPALRTFQEEFYSEFEIIDEEAEKSSLNTKQILLLNSYLAQLHKKLEKFIAEENKQEIEDIKSEISDLQNNLTRKSKKWVVEKLSNVWSKIAKQGTNFIKEFLSESKKEVIKQSVKGLIEFVKENGTELLT